MTAALGIRVGAAVLALSLTVAATPPSAPRPENSIRLGNAAYQRGDYERALARYRSAVEQRPAWGIARLNIGDAFYRLGRLVEATEAFEAAARLATDSHTKHASLHNLGNALVGTGRLDAAEQAFRQALMIRPDAVDTLHNLAWVRARILAGSRKSAALSRRDAQARRTPSLTPREERRLLAAAREAELRGRSALLRPTRSVTRVDKYW